MQVLDLPPELIILAFSYCNIREVHTFRLVCRTANEIIESHHASIYRALAIRYGLTQDTQDLQQLFEGRKMYFDWLKEPRDEEVPTSQSAPLVDGWKEYVKCHFLLERNWKEGQYVLHPRFDQNGAHRIQVDEVEGTILSTRTAGSLRSECMKKDLRLWTHSTAPAWTHCEFDNGFLIWGRRDKTIEVWRRDADQINEPLPACDPAEDQKLQYTLSQRQAQRAQTMEDPSSDSDSSGSNRDHVRADQHADLVAPIRGCFQPFLLLSPPTPTSASRYVHPHLVLVTRFLQFAYIYDIPNNRLVKTLTLQPADDGRPSTVYYVEHSRIHVFICTEDAVYIYTKDGGRLFATVRPDVVLTKQLKVATNILQDPDISSDSSEAQKMQLLTVHPVQALNAVGEYSAIHVSPCGGIWVIMKEMDEILVIVGGAEDPARMKVVSVQLDDPDLFYLAFDGHHIAVAGSKGIYVISLNRFRDPTIGDEAVVESLVKGHVQLIPLPHVDIRSTSCLQLTDTAIWHVARRSLREFGSVITSLDFAPKIAV